MSWQNKTLYDRIVDRWKEQDNDYAKMNYNRAAITALFRSDELIEVSDKGELLGQNIYNGAGPWYSRMMATGFQGSLVSKNIAWIRYQMSQYGLKGVDELDIWLQDIKDYMTDVYNRSNFYDVQPQFTHDGITTGSPLMFAEENILTGKTMWMPQHYTKVRLFYDKYNEVEGVIVKDRNWTAKHIFDTFVGEDDEKGTKRRKKLSMEVNRALDAGKLQEEFTIYRATFKVTDPIWDGKDQNAFKKPQGDWSWLSVYMLELSTSDVDKRNTPLNENMGDFSQPFAYWNFDKKPWEVSSRTPAFYAIWDCMGLQQIHKNYLEDIQYANRPAIYALKSMENRLKLSPEGEMFVSDDEYERPPKPIDRVAGFTPVSLFPAFMCHNVNLS